MCPAKKQASKTDGKKPIITPAELRKGKAGIEHIEGGAIIDIKDASKLNSVSGLRFKCGKCGQIIDPPQCDSCESAMLKISNGKLMCHTCLTNPSTKEIPTHCGTQMQFLVPNYVYDEVTGQNTDFSYNKVGVEFPVLKCAKCGQITKMPVCDTCGLTMTLEEVSSGNWKFICDLKEKEHPLKDIPLHCGEKMKASFPEGYIKNRIMK